MLTVGSYFKPYRAINIGMQTSNSEMKTSEKPQIFIGS